VWYCKVIKGFIRLRYLPLGIPGDNLGVFVACLVGRSS
jgi:hypothetical protein